MRVTSSVGFRNMGCGASFLKPNAVSVLRFSLPLLASGHARMKVLCLWSGLYDVQEDGSQTPQVQPKRRSKLDGLAALFHRPSFLALFGDPAALGPDGNMVSIEIGACSLVDWTFLYGTAVPAYDRWEHHLHGGRLH